MPGIPRRAQVIKGATRPLRELKPGHVRCAVCRRSVRVRKSDGMLAEHYNEYGNVECPNGGEPLNRDGDQQNWIEEE